MHIQNQAYPESLVFMYIFIVFVIDEISLLPLLTMFWYLSPIEQWFFCKTNFSFNYSWPSANKATPSLREMAIDSWIAPYRHCQLMVICEFLVPILYHNYKMWRGIQDTQSLHEEVYCCWHHIKHNYDQLPKFCTWRLQ